MARRFMIISGRMPAALKRDLLVLTGTTLLPLPPCERLSEPLADHPDMLILPYWGGVLTDGGYLAENRALLAMTGAEFAAGELPLEPDYPGDVRYNSLIVGDRVICRAGASEDRIIGSGHYRVLNVKQGYARCSVCMVYNEGRPAAAVTADEGIARALEFCGLEVLLICPEGIELPGMSCGFIGGASCSLPDGRVLFFGALESHPDGGRIADFIVSKGGDPISCGDTGSGQLFDWGGAVIIGSGSDGLGNIRRDISRRRFGDERYHIDGDDAVGIRSGKDERSSSRDGFWDIGRITPKRDKRRFVSDTEAVELDLGEAPPGAPIPPKTPMSVTVPPKPDTRSLEGAFERIIPPSLAGGRGYAAQSQTQGGQKIEVRKISDSFILEVEISGETKAAGSFAVIARKCIAAEAAECKRVPFAAEIATHYHMNRQQQAWYLWWRRRLLNGEALPTDYSCIRLMMHEIIALPDTYEGRRGFELLCLLWRSYRDEYPKLDGTMAEWVADYCLLNGITPDPGIIGEELIDAAVKLSQLREFWLGSGDNRSVAQALCRYYSAYSPTASRYYNDETAPVYREHIAGVFKALFSALGGFEKWYPDEPLLETRSALRLAYIGAGVAIIGRCYLKIKYRAFSRSRTLGSFVGDMLRYTENYIRTLLGIVSKYKVKDLPASVAGVIDGYFAPLIAALPKKKAEDEPPEYEKQYEALSTGFTAKRAFSIEKESWDNARALAVSETDITEPAVPQALAYGTPVGSNDVSEPAAVTEPADTEEASPAPQPSTDDSGDTRKALAVSAIRCLLNGDTAGYTELARGANLLPAALMQHINDTLYDELGDIAVEERNGGFEVIEDYIDELREICGM